MSPESPVMFPKHSHQFIVSPSRSCAQAHWLGGADVINRHCRNREKAFTITD
jgi:hypothetical protein